MAEHSESGYTGDRVALDETRQRDFIREIVAQDVAQGRYGGRVVTRFPPEPNGFLHIGHAKSICLNFGVAADFDGVCNLRFDDTNPETEDMVYVEAIKNDIRWLGFDWEDRLYFASDYYEELCDFAVQLIKAGLAYVDSLSEEQIRDYRGTVTEPGRNSPFRERAVAENLDLFRRMQAGEFPDSAHVLRAKIDMAAPNMKMRDPLLYRIRHANHYRSGNTWCIYPMYDFAHPLSDAIEGVTHSICTLEFENNREIYDWLLENTQAPPRPKQYEFARLQLDYTVMSKRKLLQLVDGGYVSGWDDPRMPTLAGLRRRGVTPAAIRAFSERIGVAKTNSRVELSLFEHTIRDDLNSRAPRVLCVLRPLRVMLENYPEDKRELLDASYWPRDIDKQGSRQVPFGRELWIEREDFAEEPPKGFYRLAPGQEVRLRHAYVIKCVGVDKDPQGEVIALRCTVDMDTLGRNPAGRKVRGTIHWVSVSDAVPAEVRLYDRLFRVPDPEDGDGANTFLGFLNPNSLEVIEKAWIEPSVCTDPSETRYQFERQGYFIQDSVDSSSSNLVYNRIIDLRDSWAKPTMNGHDFAAQTLDTKPQIAKSDVDNSATDRRTKLDLREEIRHATPELATRLHQYTDELGLSYEDADVLTGDLALALFFEETVEAYQSPQTVANWVTNEVLRETKDQPLDSLSFSPVQLAKLVELVDKDVISATMAKDVFAKMAESGRDPGQIVDELGLEQITDVKALEPVIVGVLAAHDDEVEAYRSGKTGLLGFFTGQVMRTTKGKANPQLVQQLLRQHLES